MNVCSLYVFECVQAPVDIKSIQASCMESKVIATLAVVITDPACDPEIREEAVKLGTGFTIQYNISTRQIFISPWKMMLPYLHQLTPPTRTNY